MIMQKKIAVLFSLVLFFSVIQGVNALTYSITGHSIDVFVSIEGKGRVNEKFYLKIPYTSINEFKKKSTELGSDLKAWQEFDSRFNVSINSIDDIIPGSGNISFIESLEQSERYVELSYSLKTPLFIKTNETSRMTEFKLSKDAVRNFLKNPFFIVPENTVLTFILPIQVSVLKENVVPEAEISSDNEFNYVSWTGLKKSTTVALSFTYWKEISPGISIAVLLKEFLEQEDIAKALIILLIGILLVFAYFNKKKIETKIEGFIENHTELKEKEE